MHEAVADPTVTFSKWTLWGDRVHLRSEDGKPSMGVYLWARFEHPSAAEVPSYPELCQQIIYVGEANDLNVRPLGPRHDRLEKYEGLFPDDRNCKRLYVSVAHIRTFRRADRECHAMRAYTRFVEARIGWEYTKRFGRRPLLDYKRGKDEFALPTSVVAG